MPPFKIKIKRNFNKFYSTISPFFFIVWLFLMLIVIFSFYKFLFVNAVYASLDGPLGLTVWESEQHALRIDIIQNLIREKQLARDVESLFCISRVLNSYVPETELEYLRLQDYDFQYDVSQTSKISSLLLFLFFSIFFAFLNSSLTLYLGFATNYMVLVKSCQLYLTIIQQDYYSIAYAYDLLVELGLIKDDF